VLPARCPDLKRQGGHLRGPPNRHNTAARLRRVTARVPISARTKIEEVAQTILLNPVGRDVAEDREQMERLAAEVVPKLH
jgi:hypothetical protein